MDQYVSKIMSNHVFNSESSEDLSYLYSDEDTNLKGGDKIESNVPANNSNVPIKDSNVPTGGFPPIFIISETRNKELEKIKDRQLASTKTTVSIKDILKNKK